jgi:hypothetical protein
MKKTTIAAVPLLLLAACSSASDAYYWNKPGASSADLQHDSYECERDMRAGAASFGVGVGAAAQAEAFGQRCMSAKGYRLTRAYTPGPPIQPTPMADRTGHRYSDNDRVMCSFPSLAEPVNLQAKACSQGGGLIVGPA